VKEEGKEKRERGEERERKGREKGRRERRATGGSGESGVGRKRGLTAGGISQIGHILLLQSGEFAHTYDTHTHTQVYTHHKKTQTWYFSVQGGENS